MEINLKEFREKALNMSQQDFADKLGVTQNTVSRWEVEPSSLSIAKLNEIAEAFGYELADLLSFSTKKVKYEPWKSENQTWILIKKELNKIKNQLKIAKSSREAPLYQNILVYQNYATQKIGLLNKTSLIGRKPTVTFTGASDTGKSTMINTLLGDATLPAKWTPTTSSGTKLVHIDDKPIHMDSNSTAVFATNIDEPLIQTHLLDDKEYFNKHLIKMGGRNLIEDFGTHAGEDFKKNRGSRDKNYTIVSYLDAPILEQCEIWDVPGTEASSDEKLSDDYTANVAKQGADVVIYLSVSNQFMHNFDMQYLKEAVDTLPRFDVNYKEIKPFENLFIVASQAHIVIDEHENNDIKDVMRSRIDEFGRTLPDGYWDKLSKTADPKGDLSYSLDDIQKRAFTFERDRKFLQKDFKEAFISLLDKFSYMKLSGLKNTEETLFSSYDNLIDKESQKLVEYIEDSEKAKFAYESFMKAKPEFVRRNLELISLIQDRATFYKVDSHAKIGNLYDEIITVDNIKRLIDEKGFGKKKEGKEQFTSWLQNDLNSKADDIIRKNAEAYSKDINDKLEEYEKESINLNVDTFNYTASVIGGLSTVATIGAFALYFSTLGNLGGYILLSQVVSLLSSMGISVGGTAAAASFVATIGGPMTLVVGIAIIVGVVVSKLAGGSWQRTLAKQIHKGFHKKYKAKSSDDKEFKGLNYKEILLYNSDKYWQDTHDAVDVDMFNIKLVEQERELAQQAQQDPDELKKSLAGLKTLKFTN